MTTKSFALLACMSLAALPTAAHGAEAFAQLQVPALPVEYDVAFDWQGFYAGIFGQALMQSGATTGIGATIGYSWAADQLILGGEVGMTRFGTGDVDLLVAGRAGWLVTDTLMIFALADLGTNSDRGGFAGLGGGAELALTSNLSARAQYEYRVDLSSDETTHLATIGLAYRF